MPTAAPPVQSRPTNIVSVSWADHLTFGDGDGRLDTAEKLARRLPHWRDELAAGIVHWRLLRARIPGRFHAARGYAHPSATAARTLQWDDLERVPTLAHAEGLQAWLYVSLFDEGWPLPPARVRAHSYHNAMHAQHVSWQSELARLHPHWLVVDRTGRRRQRGVVSLAYPEARRAFIDRWVRLLDDGGFDGLFVCLRSQSRPATHADQFGFNDPVRDEFRRRHGVDIRTDDFDRQAWRDLLGEYLTQLLREVRAELAPRRRQLGIGVARGDVLGPPLGNATLQWREWMTAGLVDHLVVDQNSSQCPSMWHQLWPMHRGKGYLQNYLDGSGLPPLAEHLRGTYAPIARRSNTALFAARQWANRDEAAELELRSIPGVAGLVFSSFRHDNAAAVAKGDWRAGRLSARSAARHHGT